MLQAYQLAGSIFCRVGPPKATHLSGFFVYYHFPLSFLSCRARRDISIELYEKRFLHCGRNDKYTMYGMEYNNNPRFKLSTELAQTSVRIGFYYCRNHFLKTLKTQLP